MARKGENIRKRADGRWEGRYKNGVNAAGGTKYSSVYGKTYTQVKIKLAEARAAGENGKFICKSSRLPFSEVLSRWLNANRVRLKGSTENKYQFLIDKHISPVLGGVSAARLTSEEINRFLDEKLKFGGSGGGGLSPAYVKSMAILIGAALRFAISEGLLPPMKITIHKPRPVKKETAVLSAADRQRLEAAALMDIDETKAGILLALHAGLRIGEICALSWEDIDFQNAVLHVRHTLSRVKNRGEGQKTKLILDAPKTNASVRDIPLTTVLLSALGELKKTSRSDFVVSKDKNFVGTRTFDYRYRSAMKAMGVPAVNFHTLRHTFATRCVEAGVDVKTISELLGHSSVNITLNTYVHSSMDQKRKQIEKICSRAG